MYNISPCKICGSINTCDSQTIANYEICYYCYVVKNKSTNLNIKNINNDLFNNILQNIDFNFKNRSNIIVVNSEINQLLSNNAHYQSVKDNNSEPEINSFLKDGRIDTIIIPNIENININYYINHVSKYITDNIEIFIGFYTSINKFKEENELNNIKYIYNIYAISKILQQSNLNLYISNFWEKQDYILLQVNKSLNKSMQHSLQLAFDNLFFKNFKKEISL